MRGIIEQVWENESRKGQKYLTVQVGGERYSVWDDKYFDTLQEGVKHRLLFMTVLLVGYIHQSAKSRKVSN